MFKYIAYSLHLQVRSNIYNSPLTRLFFSSIPKTFKHSRSKHFFQRADRVVSNRTSYSRSQAFRLLKHKSVYYFDSHNNRLRIEGPKTKISPTSRLILNNKLIPQIPDFIVHYKPTNVLSSLQPDGSKITIGDLINENYPQNYKLKTIGRLDYDTSGLLLLTTIPSWINLLCHPKYKVEREYKVIVEGNVNYELLNSALEKGVKTSIGTHYGKISSFENAVTSDTEMSKIQLIVTEGRHRMVRRMLANCGYPVISLKRIRHGEIHLGNDLQEGEFRDLIDVEREWVKSTWKEYFQL